jgi:hypothetical protein
MRDMKKCFVISPIGEDGSDVREHADAVFDFIIKPAMKRLDIDTVRADHLLEPGKITDQMFREIFSSDLCVALLTGHNPNVFYELALAQAARRPVVVLIDKNEELPFDVRDLRCVVYDLKPKSLFNNTYVDQLAAHLQNIKQRNWSLSSPFDAFFRQSGFEYSDDDQGVRQGDNSYSVTHGRLTIRVIMGRIEQSDCADDGLIALPANEFFDDDCINDPRSALGAYMQHHFAGRIPEIQALVAAELRRFPTERVEKEPGVYATSYGVATCVYLDRPLNSAARVAMVAVTTKRAGEGLRANAKSVYDSLFAIHRVMVDHRLTSLYLPTLGSGHGGLTGEFSLFCMLMSLAELYKHPSGPSLRNVNIVAYQRDEASKPSVSRKSIGRALSVVHDLFAD